MKSKRVRSYVCTLTVSTFESNFTRFYVVDDGSRKKTFFCEAKGDNALVEWSLSSVVCVYATTEKSCGGASRTSRHRLIIFSAR